MAYPPPKVNRPILANVRNKSAGALLILSRGSSLLRK
jgi:hypothetical protein